MIVPTCRQVAVGETEERLRDFGAADEWLRRASGGRGIQLDGPFDVAVGILGGEGEGAQGEGACDGGKRDGSDDADFGNGRSGGGGDGGEEEGEEGG